MAGSKSGTEGADHAAERAFTIDGHRVLARPLDPGLHVVATPIGNLGDISLRALQTLAAADLIACEDTRVTAVLLHRYGIQTPLLAYHDHNAARQRPKLIAALAEGRRVALVSDAGTPLISDPGYKLVKEVRDAGHTVIPVPGASALLAALMSAGLPTDSFLFAGFLPPKAAARRSRLAELAAVPATLVFYETGPRLAAALADMATVLSGDRSAAVARELTKAFETVRTGTLGELAAGYGAEAPPKGEIVVVIGPPTAALPSAEEANRLLAELLAVKPLSQAVTEAASVTGLKRSDLYRRALKLKDGDGEVEGWARQEAERRGRRAETLAAWLLRAKGYSILARRYRTPVGEIDLVARRGRLVAFVEVKQRPNHGQAAEAVTATGRRRIARAAAAWLSAHPAAASLDLRFDVIICTPRHLPRHIAQAFDAEGAA